MTHLTAFSLAADGKAAPRTIPVIQGEIKVSDDPGVVLSTLLGSCVAVCMWDQRAGVGGMNHFLLAEGDGSNAIKYGAYAMEMLINRLLRSGASREMLACKAFGGASVSTYSSDIGRKNAEFARAFLADEGIPCIAESLGGTMARRVVFTPTTGAARMLLVKSAGEPRERIAAAPRAPDVTLF